MTIGIIGCGYVGLVTGTCLANIGHTVHCIDIDIIKINNLNNGIIPIYEPGLEDLIKKNVDNETLFFTDKFDIIESCDAVFSCVGTPSSEDGSCDLSYVFEAAKTFGQKIKKRSLFINKSTVPVGTAQKVYQIIKNELKAREEEIEFDVVSNPEFLQEGCAIDNFINPERIVIGCNSDYAKIVMLSIYKTYLDDKIIITTIKSAEMTKYAANAMLATRISFINDIANLCDVIGGNIKDISKAIGLDSRIGPKFLNAGCGFGGSCFPKDVNALINIAEENNVSLNVIKGAKLTNQIQKHVLYKKLVYASSKSCNPIKNIAILGLSFKPNTDDMREASSITLINDLLNDDLKLGPFDSIRMYDPIAIENAKKIIGTTNEKLIYCEDIDTTIMDADAIIIVTEWEEIKKLNLEVVKKLMRGNIIIDGRNIFDRYSLVDMGFIYDGIGTGI